MDGGNVDVPFSGLAHVGGVEDAEREHEGVEMKNGFCICHDSVREEQPANSTLAASPHGPKDGVDLRPARAARGRGR